MGKAGFLNGYKTSEVTYEIFSLNIDSITVYLTNKTDKVHINTCLPSPFPIGVSSQNLVLEFDAQSNHGEEYVKRVYGIDPIVKNIR